MPSVLASSTPPASRPPSAATPAVAGFADLDDRLRSGAPGVLLVHVACAGAASAVAAHVARCARSMGANVIQGQSRPGAPLWRDIAVRLGIPGVDCGPKQCAAQIAANASGHRAIIVAPLPWIGTWDRTVASELCSAPSTHLTVLVSD